jgi:hypothetical protein
MQERKGNEEGERRKTVKLVGDVIDPRTTENVSIDRENSATTHKRSNFWIRVEDKTGSDNGG